jgi:hypothetical protein
MKHLLILSFFLISLFLFSCSGSLNTFSEYDKHTDFNVYKTYAWLSPFDSLETNLQNQQMQLNYSKVITYASDDILKKKGMKIDVQNPDVVFKFSLGLDHKMTLSQSPTLNVGVAVGSPFYYGGMAAGYPYYGAVAVPVAGGKVTERRADEAFLYIQMFDTKTGYVLWTGGARKTVDNSADSQKNITLALQSIFSQLKIRHKIK